MAGKKDLSTRVKTLEKTTKTLKADVRELKRDVKKIGKFVGTMVENPMNIQLMAFGISPEEKVFDGDGLGTEYAKILHRVAEEKGVEELGEEQQLAYHLSKPHVEREAREDSSEQKG
ncbi:MAG: hypothetical protein ACXQT3_00060 [Methermicoccaceae archaeon]